MFNEVLLFHPCSFLLLIRPFRYVESSSVILCYLQQNLLLQVYDGLSIYSPGIGRFCEKVIPGPIRSYGPRMLVYFRSFGTHRPTNRGFNATYERVEGMFSKGAIMTS